MRAAPALGGFAFVGRRGRGAADQLLFLAAGLPDLLRQAALGRRPSISSTRSTTRTATAMTITPEPRMPATTRGRTRPGAQRGRRPAPAAIIRTKARGRCWCRWPCSRSARSSPGWPSRAGSSRRTARRISGRAASPSAAELAETMERLPLIVKLAPGDRDADRLPDRARRPISATPTGRRASSAASGCSTPSCSTNGISTSSTTVVFVRPAFGSAASSGSRATRGRSTASARTAPRLSCASATC